MLFLSCLKSLHPRINHNIWTWFGIFMGTWWDSVTIAHHKTHPKLGSHIEYHSYLDDVYSDPTWLVNGMEKTTAIRVVSEVITSFRYGFYGSKCLLQGRSRKYPAGEEMEEPRIHGQDGRSRGSPSAWSGRNSVFCLIVCFWYFVLKSFFQSGLESPRQFLLWAGEPKVNLRLLLSKTLSWWGWYRGYLQL